MEIRNNYSDNLIHCYLSKSEHKKLEFTNKDVIDIFREYNEIIDLNKFIKIFNLSDDILYTNINKLNLNIKRKISILISLINNDKTIILYDPTLFLYHKDILVLTKLIRKLVKRYNKTIVIFSNDSNFVYSICDKLYIISNSKIELSGNKSLLEGNLVNAYDIEVPNIVKFINASYVSNNNVKYTNNILDLIKSIYRGRDCL